MNFQKVVNIPVTNLYCEPGFGSEMATQCVLGVFYIWSGKAPSGTDYSGLVQSLFKLCVISLARDAWMQESLPSPGMFDISEADAGDLMFLAENNRIINAGIFLGENYVIPYQSFVKINSLEPLSKLYSNRLRSAFFTVKSIKGLPE